MKKILLFSLVLAAFAIKTKAQSSDNIQKMPPAHWQRPQKIDVQHIALDLRFDWAKKQAIGTATIQLAPLRATDEIALDAADLTINSIKLSNGTSLKFESVGGAKDFADTPQLNVRLEKTAATGEILTLKIDYYTNWSNPSDPNNGWGSFGDGIRFFQPTSTEPRKRRQIWSHGEPGGSKYWFPCHELPSDFFTTELMATVEKNLTVISNGILSKKTDNSDGTRTFHWKMDTPHASHQTSFIVGEYLDFQQKIDGVKLHSFGYPDEMAAVEASVERLPDMVQFFSKMTGAKYPFGSYSQVFVQEFPWGGGHNIGLSTISENMVDDFGTHADFFYLWDGVEAHDLAAQWFGNLLTPHDWSQAWLSKGFARYFADLFTESKNGRDEYLLWDRPFELNTYFADWNSGIRRPVVTQNFESTETMCRDNYSSLRGALVLHLLRKELGEENWQKSIKNYVRTHAGKAVSTEDFRRAIEAETGEPMDWFFDQWLFKMGHPVFEVEKKYDSASRQMVLTVRQTQKIDPKNQFPQVEFFQGHVEIEIDGRVERVWISPKFENVFEFAAAENPRLVNFDFQGSWIKELKFEKTLDELLFQFQNDSDVVGRRTAMNALAILAKKPETSAADRSKIHAAFRQVISGKTYWRVRYSAILTLQNLVFPAATDQPPALDEATETTILAVAKNEKSWNRAAAVAFLGMTRDEKHFDFYEKMLADSSDRVVNAAATAIGKTRSKRAFDVLEKLKDKPSWKNQSLISSLNGLKELGDPRGAALALAALRDADAAPRWTLLTSVWDFRLAGAETLAALKKAELGYPIALERFKKSLIEDDLNDIFSNVLVVATLGDPRGQEVFDTLRLKFKDDPNAILSVENLELQFKSALK